MGAIYGSPVGDLALGMLVKGPYGFNLLEPCGSFPDSILGFRDVMSLGFPEARGWVARVYSDFSMGTSSVGRQFRKIVSWQNVRKCQKDPITYCS